MLKPIEVENFSEVHIPSFVTWIQNRSNQWGFDYLNDAVLGGIILGNNGKSGFFVNRLPPEFLTKKGVTTQISEKDIYKVSILSPFVRSVVMYTLDNIYDEYMNSEMINLKTTTILPNKLYLAEDTLGLAFGYCSNNNTHFFNLSNHNPQYSNIWFKNKTYSVVKSSTKKLVEFKK